MYNSIYHREAWFALRFAKKVEPPAERRREERKFAANSVPIGLLSAHIV
jgi:hypothetical protein